MKTRFNPVFVSLIVIGSAAIAQADSASWTGATSGIWTDTSNWSGPPAVVPSVSGDIATFNSAGNSNTTITGMPSGSLSEIRFESAAAAAYTLSTTSTWTPPANGGVTVTDTVTTPQNLSGINAIRPAGGTTINFVNQGAGLLKLGTIFNTNTVANQNARVRFAPADGSVIEIASGKLIDNASTAGRTTSILLDDAGTLKMSGTGNYTGTDAEGNALTLHRGTMQISTVNNIADTGRSGIGRVGRIQFGQASQTYTATLQYTHTAGASTDRPFHIIDGNTGVFDITDPLVTLNLTGVLTASGTANGGGNLTKKGPGTLKISGTTNTFNGVTRIEAGTLVLGDVLAIQNSAYDTSCPGTLDLSLLAGNPTFGGLTSSTNYNLPSNLTLSPPTGRTVTFSGRLGESSPILELTKSGGGTQVLEGDNTFTGNVIVTAGRLTLAHSNALGLADPNPPYNGRKGLVSQGGSRSIWLKGGITIPANFDFWVSSNSGDGSGINNESGNNEIRAQINFSTGNPSLNISSAADTLTISGNITMISTARTLHLGGASGNNNTISGDITESTSAIMPLIKRGTGKWILSGTNTYKGDTDVLTGTLVLTGSQRFYPKAGGSSNMIKDSDESTIEAVPVQGVLTLNGDFDIDLTDAALAPDTTSWLLVDVNNLAETFDTNFTVTGFTESPAGTWKKTEGGSIYTFTESDGRLVKTAAVTSTPFQDWMSTNFPAITAPNNDPDDDPDGDGVNNFAEFSFSGNPGDSSNYGLQRFGIENLSGTDYLTYTFACRSADPFTGTAPATVSKDGVDYAVRASLDLSAFTLAVDEVVPAITTGLPVSPSGYSYRTFRVTSPKTSQPKAFIQVKTSPTP